MSIKKILLRAITWWNGQTLNTQIFTLRSGVKVGEDEEGNLFFRNANDSKRWVIFNGTIEASKVSPEWHGWLHKTWDEPPTKNQLPKKSWEKVHQPNLTGSNLAYLPPGSIRNKPPKNSKDYEPWQPD